MDSRQRSHLHFSGQQIVSGFIPHLLLLSGFITLYMQETDLVKKLLLSKSSGDHQTGWACFIIILLVVVL